MAGEGRTDLFAQIRLYNSSGSLAYSLSASHMAEGIYTVSWTPVLEGYFSVVGQFYIDALHTVDAGYEKVGDSLEVNSTKSAILRIAGLHHENAVVDNQAYNLNGDITAA